MTRPKRLVAVTGTGTEIGKTWVGAALTRGLRRRGVTVAARKPAQSYAPEDSATSTDAWLLGDASGEPATTVCPAHRWYPLALAPPMAAEALALPPFTIAELVQETERSWPSDQATDVGLVEGAGGVASPQASDGDMTNLISALGPDLVVLVAEAALGTINMVRLSVAALAERPVTVYLNRYDEQLDLHRRNRRWLQERCGVDLVTEVESLADRVSKSLTG